MNLELNFFHILVLSLALLVTYYPVNKAVHKDFNCLAKMYLITISFRLLFVVVAFKVCNVMDIAVSLLVMIVGEVVCAKIISNKIEVKETVAA
jgi:hypothetical protein